MKNSNLSNDTIIKSKFADAQADEDKFSMSTLHCSRKKLSRAVSVSQRAYLEISGLKENPIGYELDQSEIQIGRRSDCEIKLPLHGVSRIHARIYFQDDEYYLEDLGSTNGTYINTIKIVKCVLRNNDQIEIGEAKIIFVEEKTRQ